MPFTKLHLTDINEFLITEIFKYKAPVEADIKEFTTDGFIKIEVSRSDKLFDNQILDFDLQACEYSGLNEHDDISEYIGKTLRTSSAYEFVEFLTACSSNSKLLVNVENDTWVIKLINFSEEHSCL
jgi:hypothetical protein